MVEDNRPMLVYYFNGNHIICSPSWRYDKYNVFFMFIINFFVLNSHPMSVSLKNLSIFVDSRSKVNLKVKYDFSVNEARNKCRPNTSFPCDFAWAIHF